MYFEPLYRKVSGVLGLIQLHTIQDADTVFLRQFEQYIKLVKLFTTNMCNQYRCYGFVPSTSFPKYIQVEHHTVFTYNTEASMETAEQGYATLESLSTDTTTL